MNIHLTKKLIPDSRSVVRRTKQYHRTVAKALSVLEIHEGTCSIYVFWVHCGFPKTRQSQFQGHIGDD